MQVEILQKMNMSPTNFEDLNITKVQHSSNNCEFPTNWNNVKKRFDIYNEKIGTKTEEFYTIVYDYVIMNVK